MKRILVPLDGSEFGEHSLPLAMRIAKRSEGTLHLVSVIPISETIGLEGYPYLSQDFLKSIHQRHERYLAGVAEKINANGVVAEVSLLYQGESISDTIVEHAHNVKPDLVTITTHGRGGLARLFLGSIADRLIRQLPMPLLVVRPHTEKLDMYHLPALKKILLPLDGEPDAEKMLPSAGKLTQLMNAELTLLRVITPLIPMDYHCQGFDTLDEEVEEVINRTEETQAHLQQQAESYLNILADDLRKHGLTVHTMVVQNKHPASAILELTEKEQFDLISLETHGRKGVSRLILGSVADKLIRTAHVPVMVHRPLAEGEE